MKNIKRLLFILTVILTLSSCDKEVTTPTSCSSYVYFYNNDPYQYTIYFSDGSNLTLNPYGSYTLTANGTTCISTKVYSGTIFMGYGTDICPCYGDQNYVIDL